MENTLTAEGDWARVMGADTNNRATAANTSHFVQREIIVSSLSLLFSLDTP